MTLKVIVIYALASTFIQEVFNCIVFMVQMPFLYVQKWIIAREGSRKERNEERKTKSNCGLG
jgi:hypothetical protein